MEKQKKQDCNSKGGFTLIEVILVVIIIVTLAGVLGPRIVGRIGTARQGAAPAKITRIEHAIAEYEMEFFVLPSSLDDLTKVKDGKGPFLKQSELKDPWGQQFQYAKPGSHNRGYDVWTTSPDGDEFNSWD